jgi:two-component system OmpR family response regulator
MENFSLWQPSTLCPAKILLVESEKDLAGSIIAHLTGAGLSACTVASGIEMERMVNHRDFDLIILDAVLSGEDGFRIC